MVVAVLGSAVFWFMSGGDLLAIQGREQSFTDTEAGFEAEPTDMLEYRIGEGMSYSLEELRTWERPDGPVRVGVQVGHLDNDAVPDELSGLTSNGVGATAAGFNERDTCGTNCKPGCCQPACC